MDNKTYIAAWKAIDPLMEEYLTLKERFTVPNPPTQADLNRVHAEFVVLRDSILAQFGVTMDELTIETGARLDAKLAQNNSME